MLLHGFEEYGTDLLNKLRGMFAFIIWDKNTKTLFGARDYFGIKPFYYAKMQGTLMFGSTSLRSGRPAAMRSRQAMPTAGCSLTHVSICLQ